ncbi:hypothetical protein [Rubripirellula reticaptiva]|uniref:Uncharacterized protein n=1 Tax=Rubripirellula reticaptiva TaxID=2528013 RepID=A0A5C6EM59_9BACT|nr:hypothetical protein [Rubripirellula reticaptiva]TWU49480.1 hypothetical protein Poly59_40950 [Rubripirellula reticaptiva]
MLDDDFDEELCFLLRVLIGNSLPFLDSTRFKFETNYREALVYFTVGAASATVAAERISREVLIKCCSTVLVEIFDLGASELLPLIGDALASEDKKKLRLREMGELSMKDLERALKRFAYAMESI